MGNAHLKKFVLYPVKCLRIPKVGVPVGFRPGQSSTSDLSPEDPMSKGGGVSIPSSYSIKLGNLDGGGVLQVDSDLDNIRIKEFPALEFRLKEMPVLTANSNLAVKELPPINS